MKTSHKFKTTWMVIFILWLPLYYNSTDVFTSVQQCDFILLKLSEILPFNKKSDKITICSSGKSHLLLSVRAVELPSVFEQFSQCGESLAGALQHLTYK